MIARARMQRAAAGYAGPRIGVMGSHSALEVMDGAKDEGFRTVVYCQRGREGTYRRFGRLADEVVVMRRFADMASAAAQREMLRTQTLLVPHRSLAAYLGYGALESRLAVPLFGNRRLFRYEERRGAKNQYLLMRRARLRHPRVIPSPSGISGPVIVKVQERGRALERAFFTATSPADYREKAARRVREGLVSEGGLRAAAIEEMAVGTYLNLNYFRSPLDGCVEFVGAERRLQTNIHDFNALPAAQQLEMGGVDLQNIEVGHTPASLRESLLEEVLRMGDRFARAAARECPPGVIGPFSLQSVVTRDLEFVVYDLSLRVPGNPIVATTSPYTKYQHGRTLGVGRRIAMEVSRAVREERLAEAVT